MRIIIPLLSVLLLFFTSSQVLAQSHNTTSGSLCKFAKNSVRSKNIDREGHIKCAACDKEEEQEADAKKVEDKRVEEARIAKAKADIIAKQEADAAALKKKGEEDKGVTTVYINMPGSGGKKAAVTKPAPAEPVKAAKPPR